MTLTKDQLNSLESSVRSKIGDPLLLEAPEGPKDSLALCIIDSIQSTGIRYANVIKVRQRYCDYRRSQGADPSTDGVAELLTTFDDLGSPEAWARQIGTEHKTSTTPSAPLKAVAIRDTAMALSARKVNTTADLRALVPESEHYNAIKAAWLGVVGQKSGITWRYALMLAGVPGVKPDRMIKRFVGKALGLDPMRLSTSFAAEAVEETAKAFGNMDASALDHAMWRYQRSHRAT